jgi:hypothetical protein
MVRLPVIVTVIAIGIVSEWNILCNYSVFQEESAILQENVPQVKLY